MDKISCSECDQTFCSKYNLLRHSRNKHAQTELGAPIPTGAPQGAHLGARGAHLGAPGAHFGAPGAHFGAPGAPGAPPPPPQVGAPPPPPQVGAPPPPQVGAPLSLQGAHFGDQLVILHHPFTMMITGPTACGKTSFTKILLQHHQSRIQPSIQRIVWLYRRWQPLYTEIERSVSPKVEFFQGLPTDLDEDDYFNPNVNNLVILDDLMSTAGKDSRITSLFTEGSHHRNLSVITINQNLYANKDPTQRRNCHYLVLFNNPVDKQSMMTLAKQMYPGTTDIFLKALAKATKQPYGYLLVDLKPFTPENERLKWNVTWERATSFPENQLKLANQKPEMPQDPIKRDSYETVNHSCKDTPPVQTDGEFAENSEYFGENQDEMADKMNSCDDCGLLFDTQHDVQRHVKRGWCAENAHVPPTKKQKLEQTLEESVEDNKGYLNLWREAQDDNVERFNKLYDQFIKDGEIDEEARELAEERIKPYNERSFFQAYIDLITDFIIPLQNSELHHHIVEEIQTMTQKGLPQESAVKRVLKKNADQFQDLFDTEFSDEEDSDDGSEEDEESEDEDESE